MPHMNPDWFKNFIENGNNLIKFARDNTHDENHHMFPKTNQCNQCNQPLLANIIGHHFRTFKQHDYTGQ